MENLESDNLDFLPTLPRLQKSEVQPIEIANSTLTVVDIIYYQPVNDSPITVLGDATRFSRKLDSNEDPYERRKVATEDWKPLDFGWIDKGGMLVIRNNEGLFSSNPTKEQKERV
jgi:hypothetical protein